MRNIPANCPHCDEYTNTRVHHAECPLKGKIYSDGEWFTPTPAYENEAARAAGLVMTCNGCDRIIWEQENDVERYTEGGGYCRDCRTVAGAEPQYYSPKNIYSMKPPSKPDL